MDRRDQDQRDQELDALLAPLRDGQPTELELRRWQLAVERLAKAERRRRLVWPLLAASLVGAVVGLSGALAYVRGTVGDACKQEQIAADSSPADATIEHTYVKLD